jgi:hypothetical protein
MEINLFFWDAKNGQTIKHNLVTIYGPDKDLQQVQEIFTMWCNEQDLFCSYLTLKYFDSFKNLLSNKIKTNWSNNNFPSYCGYIASTITYDNDNEYFIDS